MYFVKYGKDYLHDPRINEYILLDLTLTGEENTCGYCDFTIYPSHPSFSKLRERDMDNIVTVYDDDILLFSGFIYELGSEFYQDCQVKCKGELAYLSDSTVRPYSTLANGYGDYRQPPTSVDGYFEWLISQHNEQVKENERFVIGVNQGGNLDANNYIYRASTEYPTTWEEINDKLLSTLGGFVRVRYENDVRYIDYLSEWSDTNSQTLDFGTNLTDYSQTDDSDEIATFVIPLGAKMSETDYSYDDGYYQTSDTVMDPDKEYYTLTDSGYAKCGDDVTSFEPGVTYYEYFETFDESNLPLTVVGLEDKAYDDGYIKSNDIVYCESAVSKYGWIGGKYENSDITTKEALVSKAIIYLKELTSPVRTIEIKAVDMHFVNPDLTPIRIGEYVRVRSKPHNLDSYFLCTSVELNLNNPSNSTYTFGTTFDTLTGQQNKRIKQLNASINQNYEQAEKLTEKEKQNAISSSVAVKKSNEAMSTASDAKTAADSAVTTLVDEYAMNENPKVPPIVGWSEETPSWEEGNFIWRRSITTYGDGHSETGSPALMTGNSGENGEDALYMNITAPGGTIFKNNSGSANLTAHVFKGSVEQDIAEDGTCGELGSVKWYLGDETTAVSTSKTYSVSAENINDAITIVAKLEK